MKRIMTLLLYFSQIHPLVIKDGVQHQNHAMQKAGVLDKTFGSNRNGIVITNASAFNGNANGADDIIAMIQQQDGKIVVAGASTNSLDQKHFTLARYTANGILDSSFGIDKNGVVITNASAFNNYSYGSDIINAMLQQSDGKIVVAGYSIQNGNRLS